MAPPKYRGSFNIVFQLCVWIGILSASLLNNGVQKIKGGWGWRISLAMAAALATFLTVGAIFLPETANTLIQHGNDHQKAKQIFIQASDKSKVVKDPFKQIIKQKYRPQLVMSVVISFFQHMMGISVISLYAPILFQTIGLGASASLMSVEVTGTSVTFLALLIVDRVRRRAMSCLGGIQMFVSQMMFSWGPLSWLVPSEIFPLEIRSAGQSITVAMGLISASMIAQNFLTMNLSIESMESIWRDHWFWKRFVCDEQDYDNYLLLDDK
uniref:Major facilitator superfamily (MFS) profile domain-containing protein n=1 Tax=Solanum lycopersicum TaxID=4081 RepID=A0A3Q7FP43_SOLLC